MFRKVEVPFYDVIMCLELSGMTYKTCNIVWELRDKHIHTQSYFQ